MNASHDPEYKPKMTPRLLNPEEYEDLMNKLISDPEDTLRTFYSIFIQVREDPSQFVPLSLFKVLGRDSNISLTKLDYGVTYRFWIIDQMNESFLYNSSRDGWGKYYEGVN